MFGGGCTDGEYAVRFSQEDLRQPIIADNIQDELMVKDIVDNHRLEDWLDACMSAGVLLEEEARKTDAGLVQDGWGPILEDADALMYAEQEQEQEPQQVVSESVETVEEQVVQVEQEDVDMMNS